jgi:hypothetical protein
MLYVRLAKEGILADESPGGGIVTAADRPQNSFALLEYWHASLAGIEEDYTFGDLVSLLRGVDDIENLSPMLQCDVAALLADADRPRTLKDEEPIQYLQVCNVAILTKYEEDASRPDEPLQWLDDDEAAERDRLDAGIATLTKTPTPLKIVDATADDPITGEPLLRRLRAGEQHGTWKAPYELRREFEGRGLSADHEEAFALDLTPLSALLYLPLRYNPTVRFLSGLPKKADAVLFQTELGITLGDFLFAIFYELGFHGSPATRDEVLELLREREKAIDRRKNHAR